MHSTTRSDTGSSSSSASTGTSTPRPGQGPLRLLVVGRGHRGQAQAVDAVRQPLDHRLPDGAEAGDCHPGLGPLAIARVHGAVRASGAVGTSHFTAEVVGDLPRRGEPDVRGSLAHLVKRLPEPADAVWLTDDEAMDDDAADERLVLGLREHLGDVVGDHLGEVTRRQVVEDDRGDVVDLVRIGHREQRPAARWPSRRAGRPSASRACR